MNLAFNEPGNVGRVSNVVHMTSPVTRNLAGTVSTICVDRRVVMMPNPTRAKL
jgi:hypothetical protein